MIVGSTPNTSVERISVYYTLALFPSEVLHPKAAVCLSEAEFHV